MLIEVMRFAPERLKEMVRSNFYLLGLGKCTHRVDCAVTGDIIFYKKESPKDE